MTAGDIAAHSAMTIDEVFRIDKPDADHIIKVTEDIIGCVSDARARKDMDELSPIVAHSATTAPLTEQIMDAGLKACDSADKWRDIALGLFNELPLEKQIEMLPHVHPSVWRVGFIDQIISNLD